MTLWYIGRPIVLFYGAPTYALVWLSAGVGGGALSIYWSDIMNQAVKRKIIQKPFWIQPDRPQVGLSGSILGMIGVEACAFPGRRLWTLGFVAVSILCLENDWLPEFGHKAHLGGMAVGATWWLLFFDGGGDGDILVRRCDILSLFWPGKWKDALLVGV